MRIAPAIAGRPRGGRVTGSRAHRTRVADSTDAAEAFR